MLFNSHGFIFVFLPLCLLGFFVLGSLGWQRAGCWWLSGMSLAFYSWWNPDPSQPWSPKYLLLILGSIVFNYVLGVAIGRRVEQGGPPRARWLLVLGVSVNLLALGYFKYAGFFATNVTALLGTSLSLGQIALPLAISFFTFTQIAYLVDAFHGVTKEYNFRWYLLFVSFFPHLIAGPIVLYRNLMPQFARPETWKFNAENFAAGISLFAFGLFKKVVFADRLSPLANEVFGSVARGDSPGVLAAWTGAVAYTLQLYFDFSGYSDMALGLARMFNVQFPLNFNSPYQARDISDFWRRWHISLSTFLRDHLYIPLGGNRLGASRRYLNLFVTMLLGGLWHGAAWTFVAWGALHGLYLVIHQAWAKISSEWRWAKSCAMQWAGWATTLVAVVVGWVFFRAHTFNEAISMLRGMAGAHGFGERSGSVGSLAFIACMAAIALFAPNTEVIFRLAEKPKQTSETTQPPIWKLSTVWAVGTAIVFALAVLHLSGVSEFLYFQF